MLLGLGRCRAAAASLSGIEAGRRARGIARVPLLAQLGGLTGAMSVVASSVTDMDNTDVTAPPDPGAILELNDRPVGGPLRLTAAQMCALAVLAGGGLLGSATLAEAA